MKKNFYILLLFFLFIVCGFSAQVDPLLSRKDAAELLVQAAGLVNGAKSPADTLDSQGIMSKKSNQKYLTRAEAVTVICRTYILSPADNGILRFSEVRRDSWFFLMSMPRKIKGAFHFSGLSFSQKRFFFGKNLSIF
jgi:hypothetical protein